jgi:hypothetical protein
MGLHKDVAENNMHEPKNMSTLTGGATDVGKVAVSKGNGTTEARKLKMSELSDGAVYGEMEIIQNATVIAVPLAVDTTLYTTTDYVNVTGLFTAGTNNAITFAADALTVPVTGHYMLIGWATLESSVTNTTLGAKFTLNGTPSPSVATPTLRRKLGTGGDKGVVSANGIVALAAGDAVGLSIAADAATDVTISDGALTLVLLNQTA